MDNNQNVENNSQNQENGSSIGAKFKDLAKEIGKETKKTASNLATSAKNAAEKSKSDTSATGLDKLYVNIGNKLKGLAKFLFIIGSLFSAILAVVMFCASFYMLFTDGFGEFLLMFLLTLIGPVLSIIVTFIASWPLYAFGELVQNTTIIAKSTQTQNQ